MKFVWYYGLPPQTATITTAVNDHGKYHEKISSHVLNFEFLARAASFFPCLLNVKRRAGRK
jgi:hypothetical protein